MQLNLFAALRQARGKHVHLAGDFLHADRKLKTWTNRIICTTQPPTPQHRRPQTVRVFCTVDEEYSYSIIAISGPSLETKSRRSIPTNDIFNQTRRRSEYLFFGHQTTLRRLTVVLGRYLRVLVTLKSPCSAIEFEVRTPPYSDELLTICLHM